MVSFAKRLGLGRKPAFDYQREADEFVAHFDRLLNRVIKHAKATRSSPAIDALTGALNTIMHHANDHADLGDAQNAGD